MIVNRLLLTTPTFPYPTLPANDSLTDASGQRFTKGDGIFTVVSHTHCFANHILAQNVDVPSTLLEYPRWEDFTAEVDKGYPVIGISAFPVHLDNVMKMCEYIRSRSPATRILLGSYGGQAFQAQYDHATQKKYVDHVVHGEGVRYLRRLLGEDPDRPIEQRLMPRAGGSPAFLSKYPKGAVGFLVSGLGCPGGCDFCSTTALFDRKRIQMLTPEQLVEHIALYYDNFPEVSHVFVIEEDHFRHPEYLAPLREYWESHPKVSERLDWFAFGSVDYIGKFARKYGWDAILEMGVGAIFIGVESKFAGEHGYEKRDEIDARTVFDNLHRRGIRTVGAWICGWDFHDHNNMYEDLNYFVSLYPTYQQLTRLSPFPGTVLWEKLKEEGRVRDVPWEDVHFWSGAQKNINLEAHETLNMTEYGYDLLYRTWGPSVLRRLDVQLNGYAHCLRSSNPVLRRHKSLFFKRQASMIWTMTRALDRFAPNGVVRRRVRKIDQKYRELIGEPTPAMETMARTVEASAAIRTAMELFDPFNRHPKQEPFKRYRYEKNGNGSPAPGWSVDNSQTGGSPAGGRFAGRPEADGNGVIPYVTEWPGRLSWKIRAEMAAEESVHVALETALRTVRAARWRKSDQEIDDYLINLVHSRAFAFGF